MIDNGLTFYKYHDWLSDFLLVSYKVLTKNYGASEGASEIFGFESSSMWYSVSHRAQLRASSSLKTCCKNIVTKFM